jgi:hypothetical protein
MSDDGPWLNVPQAVVLEATRDIELVRGLTETNPALLVIRANQLIALRTEIPLEPDADNEQRGDAFRNSTKQKLPCRPVANTWRHRSGCAGGLFWG